MKRHILILLMFIVACGQDDNIPETPLGPNKEDPSIDIYEAILEQTGCKVKDAETIVKLFVYDENSDTKYLYGSRKNEDSEQFWVSKYDINGESLWDITLATPKIEDNQNEIESWAYFFSELNNGNLAILQLLGEKNSFHVLESRVIVISQADGRIISNIDIEGSLFTNIHVLQDGFLVYSEMKERDFIPNASENIFYIHNDGKLVQTDKAIELIPSSDDVVLDDFLFIVRNPNSLSVLSIFGETIWETVTNNWDFVINSNSVTIYYDQGPIQDYVTIDLNSFEIVIDTGVLPIQEESLSFAEIGEQYKLTNGLTLKINSVVVNNNGGGTLYYDIDYTLVNNTEKDVISEGRFVLLYKNKRGGVYQVGAFGSLYPGESINKSYRFKTLEAEPVSILTYEGLILTIDPLYWKLPCIGSYQLIR